MMALSMRRSLPSYAQATASTKPNAKTLLGKCLRSDRL